MNFYVLSLLKLVVTLFALLTACAYMVWVERKVPGRPAAQ
jgi:NADH:ubiquinone oxidoreductase subunit H